jgi:hypothetical protein
MRNKMLDSYRTGSASSREEQDEHCQRIAFYGNDGQTTWGTLLASFTTMLNDEEETVFVIIPDSGSPKGEIYRTSKSIAQGL